MSNKSEDAFKLKLSNLTHEQAYLLLCHDRFTGTCKQWSESAGSGLISVEDGTMVQVSWNNILFVGHPVLVPDEPLEFGIIIDAEGVRKSIYVTGPKGFYLNADRVQKQQNVNNNLQLPKNDDSETRTETKHLIQRLSGNLHPNGQLDEHAKSTLKQWVEEDTKVDPHSHGGIEPSQSHHHQHHNNINNQQQHYHNKRSRTKQKHRNLVTHPLYSTQQKLLNDPSQIVHAMNTQKKIKMNELAQNNVYPRNELYEKQFMHDINRFYVDSRPNLDRIQNKKRFYLQMSGYIEDFKKCYYPLDSWNVFKFGSTFWGIDSAESDMDVAIKVENDECLQKCIKQEILQRLQCYIKERSFPFKEKCKVTSVLHARCPIITVHNNQLSVDMDVSIADDGSVERTKTIIFDEIESFKKRGFPIRKFLVFVKFWSKKRCINDSLHRFVNSFGYTLMGIKYIQYLAINRIEYVNLSCLVYGFFSFYAHQFNAKKHVIDISTNKFQKEFDFNCFRRKREKNKKVLIIVDPANRGVNVTSNVRLKQWTQIKLEFKRAADIYSLSMQRGRSSNQNESYSLFHFLMRSTDEDSDCENEMNEEYEDIHR